MDNIGIPIKENHRYKGFILSWLSNWGSQHRTEADFKWPPKFNYCFLRNQGLSKIQLFGQNINKFGFRYLFRSLFRPEVTMSVQLVYPLSQNQQNFAGGIKFWQYGKIDASLAIKHNDYRNLSFLAKIKEYWIRITQLYQQQNISHEGQLGFAGEQTIFSIKIIKPQLIARYSYQLRIFQRFEDNIIGFFGRTAKNTQPEYQVFLKKQGSNGGHLIFQINNRLTASLSLKVRINKALMIGGYASSDFSYGAMLQLGH